MNENVLLLPILIPAVVGVLVLLMRKAQSPVRDGLALLATLASAAVSFTLYGREMSLNLPWAGFGMDFALRLYHFSGFTVAAIGGFGFLVALFAQKFMRGRKHASQFYAYMLFALSMANGAVLADHLVTMLFFWEGLLLVIFGLIAIGGPAAWKTATKAFIIVGVTDLCLMLGIALVWYAAGTLTISKIHLPLTGLTSAAFVLMMIGAIAKGGALPFHTWIPDAAIDAPMPFMAFLPASLEKLLGIYLLTRISLDIFQLNEHSWLCMMMMIVGAATILIAVMMALIQKDYKRLLAYHAISQVGYMILGIGTGLPIGIVGGLFHMINNALYKCCLFLTAGAVEHRAGTTDLNKLGGLGRKMPITFLCFFIAAVSISGVPPFNGFFSKELIYDAAMEHHYGFYLAALLGSFFTAASFLKLGHAAFLGKRSEANENVKEAPASMLAPMLVLAGACVLFGVYNQLPIQKFLQPVLGEARMEGRDFAGWPASATLVWLTVLCLAGALANHLAGFWVTRSGIRAVDHIHYAPGLHGIYDRAENRVFDPYDNFLKLVRLISRGLWALDRAFDWLYDTLAVVVSSTVSRGIRAAHTGNTSMYVVWVLAAAVIILVFLMKAM
jgi:NADH-quinone oxidoreductase subunit L